MTIENTSRRFINLHKNLKDHTCYQCRRFNEIAIGTESRQ